jgi:HPt (histidine-containing phosphotransfer) domain-containing protein
MTAEAMEGDRQKCLAAGMEDYLVKPVTLDALRSALEKGRPVDRESAEAEKSGISEASDSNGALDGEVLANLRKDLGEASVNAVIAFFLEKAPTLLRQLRDAAKVADADGIRRTAHTIKGTSATLGARTLSEKCAQLEQLSRMGSVPDAEARVSDVLAAYESAETALKAEMRKKSLEGTGSAQEIESLG